MAAARAWARSQRRRHRGSILALVLLVGLSSGVALTALAGARRSDTAYERLLAASSSAHAWVQYAATPDVDDEVLARLRADAGVEAAVPAWFTVAFSDASDYDIGVIHSLDPAFLRDIDRLRLTEGRMPAPDSADEVVAGELLVEEMALEIGDEIVLGTFSQGQLDELAFDEAPGGPTLVLRVVGIGSSPNELSTEQSAVLFAGPGYYEATTGRAGAFGPSILLRVRDGVDVEEVVVAAVDGLPLDEPPVIDHAATRFQRIQDATRVLAVGLVAFGACAALAALVASGQAISRLLSAFADDQETLQAMGFTRPQRFAAALLTVAPIAVAGAVLAVLVAVAASPSMPIGLARRAEPSPGMDVDLVLLSLGALVVALLVAALAALSAWRLASGPTRSTAVAMRARRSVGATAAARAGWSAPAVLGITMALEPGRGRTAVPVRPALLGSTLGVAGVIAALTFGASLDRLVSTPAAYGWNWSIAPDLFDGDAQRAAALPEVDDVGTLLFRQVEMEGRPVAGVAVLPVAGSPSLTVLAGRMPAAVDEVAVGPKTADRMGRGIGDQVAVAADGEDLDLTVVGEVLFPVFDENPFNDGVAFHPDLAGDIAQSDGFGQAIVGFAPGVPHDQGVAAVTAALPDSMTIYALPRRPENVENLARVAGVPFALAGFLVLLALAAVAHALITSVRRRARDLGIVRTLGFLRRDVVASVAVQAATLAVVGAAVGVPLGVALGRVTWTAVAGGLGVATILEVPSLALALVVVGALGGALLVAAAPARHAARRAPADVLRAE